MVELRDMHKTSRKISPLNYSVKNTVLDNERLDGPRASDCDYSLNVLVDLHRNKP